MPGYVSPARFKTMGFGIDVSELDDTELAALSVIATAHVNSYCLVPRLPRQFDFRGGTIVGEQHTWRYPETPFDIGQRRAYPFHQPVKWVNEFRIYVTNTQYVGIQPPDLFVNNTLRYVEVVSLALTSAGLFNALIIPNIGLATPVVRLSYEYGWDFYEPGEYLTPDDGQTWRAQNQWWYDGYEAKPDPFGNQIGGPPVIRVDGVETTTGFTIDYDEGTVTFTDDQPPATMVEAAYHYKLPTEVQLGTGHVMAWLHAEAEMHARGMAHLNAMQFGELRMQRPRVFAPSPDVPSDLASLVPEAAAVLATYRFDHVTVR